MQELSMGVRWENRHLYTDNMNAHLTDENNRVLTDYIIKKLNKEDVYLKLENFVVPTVDQRPKYYPEK